MLDTEWLKRAVREERMGDRLIVNASSEMISVGTASTLAQLADHHYGIARLIRRARSSGKR